MRRAGAEQAAFACSVIYWTPVIAPSNLTFYEAVMNASWGGVPNWISEPLFFPEMDELIEPDAEANALALDLFRHRWSIYRERNGLRG
jgi:hypothetical protein